MNNNRKTNISVVIPLLNEEESLGELLRWIDRVMAKHRFSYEVIFVDDGSKDGSWAMIESLARERRQVRGIRFRRNYGKSAALYCGFDAAEGDVVITMDADLQDSPEEIPELYRMITEEGYDMVSGWKRKRHDPLTKTIPSKIYNATARTVSGVRLHDMNCGLKAYRNKVVKSIEVYGEMHRYIPILAKWAGFTKIGEKEVQHRARKYGKSKFGWGRMIKGYLDLITVMFISKFGKSPMYFFGSLGTLMFVLGGGTTVYLIAEKLYKQSHLIPVRGVTDQPLFYIAITAVLLGVMLFLAGFLGELINRNAGDRNRYLIDDVLDTRRNGNGRSQAADVPDESQETQRSRRGARCEPRRQMPLTAADARATVPDKTDKQENRRSSRPAEKPAAQASKASVDSKAVAERPGEENGTDEPRKRSRRRRGRGKSGQAQEGGAGANESATSTTALAVSDAADTQTAPADAAASGDSQDAAEQAMKTTGRSRSRRRPKPQAEGETGNTEGSERLSADATAPEPPQEPAAAHTDAQTGRRHETEAAPAGAEQPERKRETTVAAVQSEAQQNPAASASTEAARTERQREAAIPAVAEQPGHRRNNPREKQSETRAESGQEAPQAGDGSRPTPAPERPEPTE
ncbi:MAG: glycosyltransferase [Rikenellaceae bacterium]|nr:glycosyltransferase [Rikenellaceae bacterium]